MVQGDTLKREVLKREKSVNTSWAASSAIVVSISTAPTTASVSCKGW